MTKENFIAILENPYHFNEEALGDMERIAQEFPYFQSASAVLLKAYKNKGDYRYADLLKKTAALTSDRSMLFEYITQTEFIQEFAVNQIRYLDDESAEDKAKPAEEKSVEETNIIADSNIKEEKPVEELKKELPKELNFEQWIAILMQNPSGFNEAKTNTIDNKDTNTKFDRIDRFLNEKPKITPTKSNDINIDIAKQSVTENDSLMTETLAKIYIAQKKYKRAIKAYRILSLKYPEKSVYFADQIKAIKKIE